MKLRPLTTSADQADAYSMVDHALDAVNHGFSIFPCRSNGKEPACRNGLLDATHSSNKIKRHWAKNPTNNIGITTGEISDIIVLDVDGDQGKRTLRALIERNGPIPKTIQVLTGAGRHIYFKHPGQPVRNSAGKLGPGLDVRGDGGYVIGAGSMHPSGKRYRYRLDRGPDSVEIAEAPRWLVDLLTRNPPRTARQAAPKGKPATARATAYGKAALAAEAKQVASTPVGRRNDALNRSAYKCGKLVAAGVIDEDDVLCILEDAAEEAGLNHSEIGRTIASGLEAGKRQPRSIDLSNETNASPPRAVDDNPAAAFARELAGLGCTDTDNAQRFARQHAGCAVHCAQKGWMIFDGKRWAADTSKRRVLLAQGTARSIATEAAHIDGNESRVDRARWSKMSLSKSGLDRMLDLAVPMMSAPVETFDVDPMLLNVENGTLDLRTGELRRHDPADMITRLVSVAYDPKATAPTFKRFLKKVLNDDPELYRFVKRAAGYTLTGSTKDQVFFYLKGRQKNGKSTFVNLIRDMLADYASHTPTETLLVKQYDNAIPNDLARLQGVRMVTAIESAPGKQLDEARVKAVTGGDPVTARFLRGEYFQFFPHFKLWFVANDDPRVRSTDDALWRRIRVIPFDVVIPDDECDPDLPAKLRAELPGILAWAVQGGLEWQRIGLAAPASVMAATTAYRERADHLKRFLAECVMHKDGGQVPSSTFHESYRTWCMKEHEQPLNISAFNAQLTALDYTNAKTKTGRMWRGIALTR